MGSSRVTYDVDLCYRRTRDNLERLAAANDAAWNAKDVTTMAGQYATDGSVRVSPQAPVINGRSAITKFFGEAFGRRQGVHRHITTLDHVEQIAPNEAPSGVTVVKPNCLQCHNVSEGTVLGAVTMQLSLSELKEKALMTVALIIVTVGVFSSFIQLFSILVITFFLVMEGDRILGFAERQLSPERRRRMRKVTDDISDAVAGYVFGNFLISVLAGAVTPRDGAPPDFAQTRVHHHDRELRGGSQAVRRSGGR